MKPLKVDSLPLNQHDPMEHAARVLPKKRLVLLAAVLVAIAGFCLFLAGRGGDFLGSGGTGEPSVERTENKDRDMIARRFRMNARSLAIDAGGAHFRLGSNSPRMVLGNRPDMESMRLESDFTVSAAGEEFYQPDHHSRTVFTVKHITGDAIVIGYKSRFDHRSFGKNRITEDTGEFTLEPFENP